MAAQAAITAVVLTSVIAGPAAAEAVSVLVAYHSGTGNTEKMAGALPTE
ncbi:MAG: hypothetical protein ACM3JG_20470 [Thiohalocapsa sp.]